jgi:methylmalonyl-CoA epimerase
MLKQIDHIGIAVYNIDESLKRYEKLFHLEAKHIETMEELSVRIAFIPVGEVMLELLQPLIPGKGRTAEFLEKHGEGITHIAYRVDNLETMLTDMKKMGFRLRDERPRRGAAGSWVAFVSPEETNNISVELVERESPREG